MAGDDGEIGEIGRWYKKFKKPKVRRMILTRPLTVDVFCRIYLSTASPDYDKAYRFVITIAESLSRDKAMPVYVLTPHSLYTAVATVGLNTKNIIRGLRELSKERLTDYLKDFIRKSTINCGKVKLVLKKNRYFVESEFPKVLETLLAEEVIFKALIKLEDSQNDVECVKDEDGDDIHSFEIDPSQVENVKRYLLNELNYPMLEEYYFSMNIVNPELNIQMKPEARPRPYQKECESKIFINDTNRVRSGLIVLPFGAGKSFVGVSAACKIKKSCLCLASNAASVHQWAKHFKLWSTIEDGDISLITSDSKKKFRGSAGVAVTTYDMLAAFGGGKGSEDYEKIIGEILNKEWGLLLLDEIDVVPEQVFRKVISITKSHCKLGLTATFVSEDKQIKDLKFLIGPKLYEANRLDLVKKGFIPDVQCVEVDCPMTKEFFSEYLKTENSKKKQALYVMNPNKFRACESLIRLHEQKRSEKIIVFADSLFALTAYANKLQKPMICGATSHDEKTRILDVFKSSLDGNTIFLSKVGYNSIDILEANVIIQISSHAGSPHHEAQRFGRILRAKELRQGKNYPFFYSLVSTETQEAADFTERQQFFMDQGYRFEKISSSGVMDPDGNLGYHGLDEETELLNQVLNADMVVLEQEVSIKIPDDCSE